MTVLSVSGAVRRMPVTDRQKRELIFSRLETIREGIIDRYHKSHATIDLAKAIAEGKTHGIIEVLSAHPMVKKELYTDDGRMKPEARVFLRFLKMLYLDVIARSGQGNFSKNGDVEEYLLGKDRKLEMHQTELMDASKYTFELVAQALMILPKVVTGKIRSDAFSSKISWLGTHEELKTKPGKLVLVFSGGSAKGVFYSGFVRAFQEAGLWPDFVVGASAGAVAASVLAAGKKGDEFDELFSIRTMKKVFSPLSMPFTFAFSIARGLVGWGFGNHLRKVLGTKTFSDIADLFVVATVQRPVNFGQTVFGRMSETNGNVSLSSNVPVWKAVWGSASMQGIIPQPTIKGLTAERLTNGEFGVKIESIKLPYATLDDGAVVEHLPIVTAELLLKEMNEDALVVAINLMNLNPMRAHMNIPEYHSLREWIALEVSSLGSSQKWYKKPFHAFRGMRKWARQEINRLFYRTAPFRTLGAYDAVSEQNAIRGVETVREKGAKILINPNHDGALDKISLLTFNGYDETKEYGYETGKEVAEMLLGKRITKPYGLP